MAPYLVSQSYAAYRHVCTWSADILQPVFWHTVADLYCHRIRFQAIRKVHSKMDLYMEQKIARNLEPFLLLLSVLEMSVFPFKAVLYNFKFLVGRSSKTLPET